MVPRLLCQARRGVDAQSRDSGALMRGGRREGGRIVVGNFDNADFRRILGHHPTGVSAITSVLDGAPVGMVVGSFSSVSLNPPLVAFFPDRGSSSWRKIKATGRFCVNVLASSQRGVCMALASKATDKFEGLAYRSSPTGGLPVLDGVVAWIECELQAVHEAGDHFIAVGKVQSLDIEHPDAPLLFFKGGYGQFTPFPAADAL